MCEDGHQVEAHKVVLISSSPFFKNLLQKTKHPHPLIYMRGLKSKDLVAMADFLYHGEANLYQENLDSFLAVAEELQLKGLQRKQTEGKPEENKTGRTKPAARISDTLLQETVDADFKPHLTKGKSLGNFSNEPNHETAIALNSNTPNTETAELSERVKSMMLVSENYAPGQKGKARICRVCGKEGRMTVIASHIEFNHITGIALPCNVCGENSSTRNALAQHKFKFHKQ